MKERLNITNLETGKKQIAVREKGKTDVKIAGGKVLREGQYVVNQNFGTVK